MTNEAISRSSKHGSLRFRVIAIPDLLRAGTLRHHRLLKANTFSPQLVSRSSISVDAAARRPQTFTLNKAIKEEDKGYARTSSSASATLLPGRDDRAGPRRADALDIGRKISAIGQIFPVPTMRISV